MHAQPTSEQVELRAHEAWEQGRLRAAFKLFQQAAQAIEPAPVLPGNPISAV